MDSTTLTASVSARAAVALAAAALPVAMLLAAAAMPAHAATKPKKSTYGAIAYEPVRRATGYSHDFKSDREARREALRRCGEPACEVLVSFRNACAAVARGPLRPHTATGATRAEAETKALRRCGHKACEVAAWACTT